jgi:hypothetical protein
MVDERNWGGAREKAGRPHEHQEYVLVEVVDFYGDKDVFVVGLYLKRDGTPNKATEKRAEEIAAHHVGEQAQSVRILKRLCCSIGDSVELKMVKASAEIK